MSTNRVVVTGYGVTSPIGNTPEEFWNSLHDGKIGIKPITKFDASEIPVFNAGEIQDFPFDKYFVKKDTNRMDTYSLYAIYAAMEALENSGLNMEEVNRDRVGVIVSSGIGGLQELEDQIIRMYERGMKRIKPMFIPKALSNMGAGNIALKIGAQGVCKSVTTACASANDAIGEAFREIKFGFHDVVLAGGAEASITKIGIGGFNALTALSTTEDPERSSIPFDKDRNGFVMGEGAGVLVIESLEHAQKRGANILAEIVGYGSNCDAYHMTTPTPDGSGAAKAIKLAINEAGIKPEDVDYVNAHGTSTPANEKVKVLLLCLYLVKMFQFHLLNHLQVTCLVLLVLLKLLQQLKLFVTALYQKLLVQKNCLTTLKLMLFTVKVKKLILSMQSQIPLVLVDTTLFLPLNVGRANL